MKNFRSEYGEVCYVRGPQWQQQESDHRPILLFISLQNGLTQLFLSFEDILESPRHKLNFEKFLSKSTKSLQSK